MSSTTIPILRYANAERAMDWLCAAFGFEVFLNAPGANGRIEHARLTLGGNMIMLASRGREGEFEHRFKSPTEIDGMTQAISIVVPDPDKVFVSARAAGATILDPIHDFEFGGRLFSCADIEQHVWIFGSHDPWRKTW